MGSGRAVDTYYYRFLIIVAYRALQELWRGDSITMKNRHLGFGFDLGLNQDERQRIPCGCLVVNSREGATIYSAFMRQASAFCLAGFASK